MILKISGGVERRLRKGNPKLKTPPLNRRDEFAIIREKKAERGMKMDEKLSGRIAALRKERGWTQEHLAQQLGVSAAAVSKWETGVSHS